VGQGDLRGEGVHAAGAVGAGRGRDGCGLAGGAEERDSGLRRREAGDDLDGEAVEEDDRSGVDARGFERAGGDGECVGGEGGGGVDGALGGPGDVAEESGFEDEEVAVLGEHGGLLGGTNFKWQSSKRKSGGGRRRRAGRPPLQERGCLKPGPGWWARPGGCGPAPPGPSRRQGSAVVGAAQADRPERRAWAFSLRNSRVYSPMTWPETESPVAARGL
jgi:hypothetical protein